MIAIRWSASHAFPNSVLRATASSFILSAMLTIAASSAATAETVRLGQINLGFYQVVGSVVRFALADQGVEVSVVEAPHAEMFPMLGRGEIDIMIAAWLPNGHGPLLAEVEAQVERLAPLYEGAEFFWMVPATVPEGLVSDPGDLARPEVAARFDDRIVSLPEATGLTASARRVMAAYGLEGAGLTLVPSSPQEWIGALKQAEADGRWIVFPAWQPHWTNGLPGLRRLADPARAYGPPDTAWLMANRESLGRMEPETLQLLQAIRLTLADVAEMDRMVAVDGLTPDDAARRWMAANAGRVAAWSEP